jgi:hypothetical protein
MILQHRGVLAQLVEHSAVNREVVGSTPTDTDQKIDYFIDKLVVYRGNVYVCTCPSWSKPYDDY